MTFLRTVVPAPYEDRFTSTDRLSLSSRYRAPLDWARGAAPEGLPEFEVSGPRQPARRVGLPRFLLTVVGLSPSPRRPSIVARQSFFAVERNRDGRRRCPGGQCSGVTDFFNSIGRFQALPRCNYDGRFTPSTGHRVLGITRRGRRGAAKTSGVRRRKTEANTAISR